MEGVLTQQAAALFQHGEGWYGVSLEVKGKDIVACETKSALSLSELSQAYGEPFIISLSSASGYLVNLQFPFGGKRKIGLVVRDELEEYFPFPVDDMSFDFQEYGKGSVLVAAVQRPLIERLIEETAVQPKIVTLNSLAIFHFLKWAKVITTGNFMFLHIDGDTLVLMLFKENRLHTVRQMVHSQDLQVLKDLIGECINDKEPSLDVCYLVGPESDTSTLRGLLSNGFAVRTVVPSLSNFVGATSVPEFFWPGIGAALLSLADGDQLNLLGTRRAGLPGAERLALRIGAGVAVLCVFVAGMSYLNLFLKDQTYRLLFAEQKRIYKEVFPKSPPVKDMASYFEQRIRSMETGLARSGGTIGASPLRILTEVSARIGDEIDVKLNEYTFDGSEFSLTGTTVSFASVEKIRNLLSEVNGIKSMEVQNVDLVGSQVKFKIRGLL
jgi:hypothetical protein